MFSRFGYVYFFGLVTLDLIGFILQFCLFDNVFLKNWQSLNLAGYAKCCDSTSGSLQCFVLARI